MRKIIWLCLTIIILTQTVIIVSAMERVYIPNISMQIGSNLIQTPEENIELNEVAVLREGRSFFPLRGIAEYYGISVDFLPETRTVVLRDSYLEATLQIDGEQLLISHGNQPIPGRIVTLEAPAYINENGVTMLPLRVIAEHVFGCDVDWNGAEQRIVLKKNYQSKRLIVNVADAGYTFNIPDVQISGSGLENVLFLDFTNDTPDGVIRYFCQQLVEQENIIYAEPDVILQGQLY